MSGNSAHVREKSGNLCSEGYLICDTLAVCW